MYICSLGIFALSKEAFVFFTWPRHRYETFMKIHDWFVEKAKQM
jgi:hypothetical protein